MYSVRAWLLRLCECCVSLFCACVCVCVCVCVRACVCVMRMVRASNDVGSSAQVRAQQVILIETLIATTIIKLFDNENTTQQQKYQHD